MRVIMNIDESANPIVIPEHSILQGLKTSWRALAKRLLMSEHAPLTLLHIMVHISPCPNRMKGGVVPILGLHVSPLEKVGDV